MIDNKKFYINGQWVSPKKPNDLKVIDPSTEEECAIISVGGVEDINDAVRAATKAFESCLNGPPPGFITATSQSVPASRNDPPYNSDNSPHLTSDDLPLPEVPITPTKRLSLKICNNSRVWFSLPKNKCSSSLWNGRSPGKGLRRAFLSGMLRFRISSSR